MRIGIAFVALALTVAAIAPAPQRLNSLKLVGFKIGPEETTDHQSVRKMVPQNETTDDWTQLVIDTRIADLPVSKLPMAQRLDDLVDHQIRKAGKGCPDLQAGPIFSYPLAGKEIAKFRIVCAQPPSPSGPLASFNIFILDKQALYQRSIMFRRMPDAKQAKWAEAIIDATHICAPRTKNSGC